MNDPIASAVERSEVIEDTALVYLSRADVAKALGLKNVASLSGVRLPPCDARIGAKPGWLPETISAFKAARPGRGRWGVR